MAKLKIPDKYRVGVSAIQFVDMKAIEDIRDSLDKALRLPNDLILHHTSSPDDVVLAAVKSTKNVDEKLVKPISDAIASLYRVKAKREEEVEAFAERVCDALESVGDEALRLLPEKRTQFKAKLMILLGADSFGVLTKVRDLSLEHERTFCTARIITDLRPVFGTKIEQGPEAVFVSHILRLAYHESSSDTKEFFVSLAADDLRELRNLIERAERKAKSLAAVTKETRIIGTGKD